MKTPNTVQTADIRINLGGISIVEPLTAAGWEWIKRNVQFAPWQETAGGIACEPNMAAAIADGATEAGLAVA